MSAQSEIEAFAKEWVKTDSHKAFYKWYNSIGMFMNVRNVTHDELCAGIWRAVEKWKHEEYIKLLENSEKIKLETK